MLKKQDVRVGRSYVNEEARIAREVIQELSRHMVRYNAFDLRTGSLLGAPLQVCHAGQLARWADREARPEEVAKLHPYEANPRFENSKTGRDGERDLEVAKAGIEQLAGNFTLHRW